MPTATKTDLPHHTPRVAARPALMTKPPSAILHLTAPSTPLRPAPRPVYVAKPVFDWLLAMGLLVLCWPMMLLAMLAVKLTSRGPALYQQTRVGLSGKVFTIYKIRTMIHNCESTSGILWSQKGDPRITPVGLVLRNLHLDELPQLWNVLRGEMSLVGPRPERPEIVADLQLSIYGYDLRHTVKPGLTGFAQVHLPPDSSILTVKNKLIYDRFYISRVSLGMDLRCLLWTACKLFGLRRLYQRAPRRVGRANRTTE